eukprot:s146_g17.t1
MTDRVDLHSVRSIVDAVDDCPPETAQNVCALWIGNRQMQAHERFIARHGHSFRFLIHRRSPDSFNDMSDLDDPLLRERIQHLSGLGPLPFPSVLAVLSPGWAQDLHRAFAEFSFVERTDEGPVAYLQTWHLNGLRASRCQHPRTVRLRSDASSWQRSITDIWDDRLDLRLPLDIFWVDPLPLNSPMQSFIGHVILLQEPQHEQAALLLTALKHENGPMEPHHVAVCGHDRLSFPAIVDLFPVPSAFLQMPLLVRRDQFIWPARRSIRVSHGDNIVIEIQPSVAPADILPHDEQTDHADLNLLQTYSRLERVHSDVSSAARERLTADVVAHAQRPRDDAVLSVPPRPLHLADLLPSPNWTLVNCERIDFIRNLLVSMSCSRTLTFVDEQWCPTSTWAHLSEIDVWTGEQPLRFDFFSDGSFHPSKTSAAAGVVLIVHTDVGPRFGGYQTAKCPGVASAPRAEATALVLALQWSASLLLHSGFDHVLVGFHYDSVYAGHVAQGKCVSLLNEEMITVVRSLVLWLEQLLVAPPTWHHVRGHSDHPWNDLADAVATRAVQTEVFTHDLSVFLDACSFDGNDFCPMQWLWLYERSLQGRPDAPVLHQLHWKFNVAAPFAFLPECSQQPWPRRCQRLHPQPLAATSIRIRVASANVLTLYPVQDYASSFLGARAEHLAQQFCQAGIHCIGLQETRCRKVGYASHDRFHVLSSSATDRGQGGVQLWVARLIPLGEGKLELTSDHFRIVHGDDRRLIVQLRHAQLKLLFVVLHAPCHEDSSALCAWWKETSSIIPSSFASWTWVLLCDANSRLGSATSHSVGGFGAEDENLKGACFHEWLLHHNLWLPQTFESSHSGSHFTWTHAVQGRGRIDYVGFSANLFSDHVCTWIDDRVDLSIVRPDHECVCADVSLDLSAPSVPASPDPGCAPARPPQWKDNVHTHAALLQAQVAASVVVSPRDHLRKKHLTDETYELIRRKRRAFTRLRRDRAAWRLYCLRAVFDGLRRPHQAQRDDRSLVAAMFRSIALAEEHYRQASLRVCYAVRQDDRTFFNDLAENTGTIAQQGFHRIWDAIKPLLPKWKNRRKHNLRCMGPTVSQQAAHYCALEGGDEVSYDDLLRQCHSAQLSRNEDLPLTVRLDQLPSRLDIEHCIQRLAANKAPGVDSIRPATVRDAGPLLSEDICHLIMKMWITGLEPLQFKGGLLHSISKKVHSTQVEHMRGIMLIDVIGKVAHSLLRQRFLPVLQSWRHPMQLGGFPRCSTTFATHYLRTFQDRARSLHLSTAVLFLDVKAAFHSMIRQLLFGGEAQFPEALCRVLRAADCDPDQIATEIARTSTRFLQDVPPCERRLLQDAHQFTWFGLAGNASTYRTSRGSRPGSPLADVAFNGMMVQVLADLHDVLPRISLMQEGLHMLGLPAPPVTWVDDVAIPIVTSSSAALEQALIQVVENTDAVFRRHGLVLNFNKQKTEVVMAFRGADAAEHRSSLLVDRLGQIWLPTLGFAVRCVSEYEHLGTIFADETTLNKEITHRRKKALNAYRQVSRGILRNRHVDVSTRLKLFESLIIPVLLHGAGNWGPLSKRSYDGLHACIMTWQRSIINDGFWTIGQLTDYELQCKWRLPPLALRLAKARLLYGFQCLRDGPRLLVDYLSSVASHKHSWFQGLRHALRWLSSIDDVFCPPSVVEAPPEQIVQWLSDHQISGPRRVRSLFRKSLLQAHVLGDAISLHRQLRDTLLDGGASFAPVPDRVPADDDLLIACDWCEKKFDSRQKLQAHVWTAHQLISDERRFVFTDTCLACHTCLWTSARLQQHLRNSRRFVDGCYAQLTWRYAPLAEAQAICVPDALRGHARLPAVSVATTSADPCEWNMPTRAAADRALLHAWAQEGLPDSLDPEIRTRAFGFADDVVSQWMPGSCIVTDDVMYQLATYVDNDDARLWAMCLWVDASLIYSRFSFLPVLAFQRLKQDVSDLFLDTPLGRLLSWQWRMDRALLPLDVETSDGRGPSLFEHEDVVDPVAYQSVCLNPILQPLLALPDCSRVPVTYENERPVVWILHLFSGRRRRGDCHFWVDCLQHLIPGFTIRILSVDTAIDTKLGNLDRGLVFSRLLAIVRKRFFASGLTGPPCETFSAARHIVLPDGHHPRPLRAADSPWLLRHRSGRELHQVMIGTRLLFHSLITETALVLSGAGSLMEHPTEHPDEDRASVWRTACHRQWILRLPDACEHHIEQWKYGSRGVKPTTLRALNMGPASLVDDVLASHVDPLLVRPHRPLKGRAEDGTFHTAAAKEYPSNLCRALVHASMASIAYRLEHCGMVTNAELSKEETDWLQAIARAQSQLQVHRVRYLDFNVCTTLESCSQVWLARFRLLESNTQKHLEQRGGAARGVVDALQEHVFNEDLLDYGERRQKAITVNRKLKLMQGTLMHDFSTVCPHKLGRMPHPIVNVHPKSWKSPAIPRQSSAPAGLLTALERSKLKAIQKWPTSYSQLSATFPKVSGEHVAKDTGGALARQGQQGSSQECPPPRKIQSFGRPCISDWTPTTTTRGRCDSLIWQLNEAWRWPQTSILGYWGCAFLEGAQKKLQWCPERLRVGSIVGLLVSNCGDIQVMVDNEVVVHLRGVMTLEPETELYPVLDIYSTTVSVEMHRPVWSEGSRSPEASDEGASPSQQSDDGSDSPM